MAAIRARPLSEMSAAVTLSRTWCPLRGSRAVRAAAAEWPGALGWCALAARPTCALGRLAGNRDGVDGSAGWHSPAAADGQRARPPADRDRSADTSVTALNWTLLVLDALIDALWWCTGVDTRALTLGKSCPGGGFRRPR
jgi:hypothetical protein